MGNEYLTVCHELVHVGKYMHYMGWVPATSGNFSARLGDGNIAITVSGKHKGKMVDEDIMLLDNKGKPIPIDGFTKKPSAETLLHVQIYNRFSDVQCVLHPHSIYATLLSQGKQKEIILQDYELLKAFPGIDTHEYKISVPVFKNDQDITRLAEQVNDVLNLTTPIYGYLIDGHGFYTWGKSIDDCMKQVEAFEFLFQCEYMKK